MKKKVTTAAIAASMLGGMAIGSFAAPPMAAFAADTTTPATADATARTPGQWISDALKGLVDKGTITQEQSDTIATTLKESHPKGGHGFGGPGPDGPGFGGGEFREGRPPGLTEAAKVLGISDTELRTALKDKSLADIAKEKNVDVQKVIDALVAAHNTRLDEAVTEGRLTQAEADQRKADVKDRVTKMVNIVPGTPPSHDEKQLRTSTMSS